MNNVERAELLRINKQKKSGGGGCPEYLYVLFDYYYFLSKKSSISFYFFTFSNFEKKITVSIQIVCTDNIQ